MSFLQEIFKNEILNISICSWFLAQVIKVFINLLFTKEFSFERFIGAGGMPSSHSSTVSALVIAIARIEGVSSSLFGISFVLASIVMYDAMGVRRAAGEQAKVINFFVEKHDKNSDYPIDKKLKEFLGHTPIEVIGGAILGILVGSFYPIIV
ncbi:MAG: divergent PAP2 family protein [Oscillospiraceae bacterium]|nr:divergent PAP2 family protein [Oscillospiraceae bacterium]